MAGSLGERGTGLPYPTWVYGQGLPIGSSMALSCDFSGCVTQQAAS